MQEGAHVEDVYRFFEGFIMTSYPVMEAKDVRGPHLALRAATPQPWFLNQGTSVTSSPVMEAQYLHTPRLSSLFVCS